MSEAFKERLQLLRDELRGGGVGVLPGKIAGKPAGIVVKVFPEGQDGIHDVFPLAVLVDEEVAALLEIDNPAPAAE